MGEDILKGMFKDSKVKTSFVTFSIKGLETGGRPGASRVTPVVQEAL